MVPSEVLSNLTLCCALGMFDTFIIVDHITEGVDFHDESERVYNCKQKLEIPLSSFIKCWHHMINCFLSLLRISEDRELMKRNTVPNSAAQQDI